MNKWEFNVHLNLKNEIVRQAIWEAYGRMCYYSSEDLKRTDMHLDHVIPLESGSDPEKLRQTLSVFNLPDSFPLDSIYNVVPSKPIVNIRKSNELLPHTANILVHVRKMIPTILKIYNKRLASGRMAASISHLRENIKSSETDVAEVYAFLMGFVPNYEDSETYIDNLFNPHFSKATTTVYLNGFLPGPWRGASCCVTFKSLDVRGLMFTMSEEDVFEILEEENVARTFNRNIDDKDFSVLKNKLFFSYKPVNFWQYKNELVDFYKVLRAYAEKIHKHQKLTHAFYGAENFSMSKNGRGYRLGKVKRRLWDLMLRFSEKHDYGEGNTDWHIFASTYCFLNVTSGPHCKIYEQGFHSMLIPEQVERNGYHGFRSCDNDMWLVWDQIKPYVSEVTEDYSMDYIWNASMTYKWVTESFIPYLIWYYEVSWFDKLLKYQGNYKKFMANFDIRFYFEDN